MDSQRTYRWNVAWPIWLRLVWMLILLLPMLRALAKALSTYRSADINTWAMTELMINNSAGFVRRGLGGSILLWLHQLSPVPFLREFGFLLALAIIFGTSLFILRALLRTSAFDGLLIMFSPVAYPSFTWYAMDTIFRKDSFVILLVIACLLSLSLAPRRQLWFALVMAWLVLPALTLTHEMVPFFCLAPFLLIQLPPLARWLRSGVGTALLTVGLVLPTVLTLASIRLLDQPSLAGVQQMCQAWQAYYPDLACAPLRVESAFGQLADYTYSPRVLDWIYAAPRVGRVRLEGLLAVAYVLAMAAGPLGRLAAIQASCRRATGAGIALLTAFIVFAPTIPMYWLGTDFGRWLAMAMTSLILMICSRKFVVSFADTLAAIGWLRLRLPAPAEWLRSLYSNLNGFILLVNILLIPQAYSAILWAFSPQFRILFKPFGL